MGKARSLTKSSARNPISRLQQEPDAARLLSRRCIARPVPAPRAVHVSWRAEAMAGHFGAATRMTPDVANVKISKLPKSIKAKVNKKGRDFQLENRGLRELSTKFAAI